MIEHVLTWAVLVMAAARITRLMVFDSFPPSAWLRSKWDTLTEDTSWNPLLHCHYCLAPWVTLILMLSALPFGIQWWPGDNAQVWWSLFGWLGLSYAASMVVSYDGDDE